MKHSFSSFLLALLLSAPMASAESSLLYGTPAQGLPSWTHQQVVYEINVRQYSPEGNFRAIEADLPRIHDLGINTLWFMPIYPIGETNRKGPLGSYYSVKDYKGVNPEFGTQEDFRSLIQKAHALGMHVIIDWVGNHSAWDNPLRLEHPEFYMHNEQGGCIPPLGTDWTDVIQFDVNNPGLIDYQAEAMAYWMTEFGVDGFRCDYAVGLPASAWERITARLREINPDVFMLAEAEQPDHQVKAFNASYGWELMHTFNAIVSGEADANDIDNVLERYRLRFPGDASFLLMTSNHDENSWNGTVFQRLGGGVETFAALTLTMDGIPLLYNGQEASLDRRLLFFERDPIDWQQTALTEVYRKLIHLRTSNTALSPAASTTRIPTTDNKHIYAFLRSDPDSPAAVLVIANLTAKDLSFDLASELISGSWTNALTGEALNLSNSESLTLQSWDYLVLYR
ncbi:MAG: alpha-glucosidase C-terminal domain-containing protein [Opitutales bacterium]|nr:alpha-glucosidase C-terminal domain-containing protein [Opitutales bacterium]